MDRFAVGWEHLGLNETDLDELVEHVLRTIQSFAIDPGTPPRTGTSLRAYLTRWLRPGIDLLLGDPIEPMSIPDGRMTMIESERVRPGSSRTSEAG